MKVLKVIMSLLVIAILMVGLFFAAFVVYENTLEKKDVAEMTNNTENDMRGNELVNNNTDESVEKSQYLPHLSDKMYALRLMSHNRDTFTEGSKEQKEFDGTIQTARTNIANGLGKDFDYKIVEQYNAITSVGGNQGKAKEYYNNNQ